MPLTIRAATDASLRATVVRRTPLPGVRAGSGLAWQGDRLAVIQDDAPAIALVDPTGRRPIEHRALPAGGWDKPTKLDLEACVSDGRRLVAFGSGSTPARERIAIVDAARARVVEAPALYAALRAPEFAGSELNVEGAVLAGPTLRLFNRGNGAGAPVDATCDLDWAELLRHLEAAAAPPPVRAVVRYELGALSGIRLTFTDAAAWGDGVLYVAVAEDSPDTYRDGPIAGAVLGRIDPDGTARHGLLRDHAGRPFVEKAEGLAAGPDGAYLVLDRDDPGAPAELCEVSLSGF